MTRVVPSLTLVRRIKAAPATVFEAWTRAEILATWWGPHHTRVLEAEIDAREGGRFRVVLVEDTGARHEVSRHLCRGRAARTPGLLLGLDQCARARLARHRRVAPDPRGHRGDRSRMTASPMRAPRRGIAAAGRNRSTA